MQIKSSWCAFTLLELLVAMAILSVVIATLFVSFRGGTTSWSLGEARAQRNQNARAALEMMTRDLMNIFTQASTLYQIEGIDDTWTDTSIIPFVVRAWDHIYFTAVSNYPDNGTQYDLCEVGYKVDTTVRALYRLQDNTVDANLSDGTPSLLSPHVVGLNLEYMSGGSWVNDYGPSTTRPAAILITLSVEDDLQKEIPKDFKTIIKLP